MAQTRRIRQPARNPPVVRLLEHLRRLCRRTSRLANLVWRPNYVLSPANPRSSLQWRGRLWLRHQVESDTSTNTALSEWCYKQSSAYSWKSTLAGCAASTNFTQLSIRQADRFVVLVNYWCTIPRSVLAQSSAKCRTESNYTVAQGGALAPSGFRESCEQFRSQNYQLRFAV